MRASIAFASKKHRSNFSPVVKLYKPMLKKRDGERFVTLKPYSKFGNLDTRDACDLHRARVLRFVRWFF